MSADPTRCSICGERPDHPVHLGYGPDPHAFKRLLVHDSTYEAPKGRWVKAVILLLVALAIFLVAVLVGPSLGAID